MQIVVTFFVLIYLAYWGSFIHLLIRKSKITPPIYLSLLLLILSSLIPDTINGYNFLYGISSKIPHRAYYAFFPILVYHIYRLNKVIKQHNFISLCILGIHTAYALYSISLNNFNPPDNNIPGFVCLIIVLTLAIHHFYQLFQKLEVPNLLKSSLFWISSGLLFYGGGTLVIELFEPLIVSNELYFALWPVHQFVLIGYIFLINKAIQVEANNPTPFKDANTQS